VHSGNKWVDFDLIQLVTKDTRIDNEILMCDLGSSPLTAFHSSTAARFTAAASTADANHCVAAACL
jgi:hypothetical protein